MPLFRPASLLFNASLALNASRNTVYAFATDSHDALEPVVIAQIARFA